MLEMLKRRPDYEYPVFLEALRKTNQTHIVDVLENSNQGEYSRQYWNILAI